MRIAVDALGAPPSGGGMRAYVEHLLDAWLDEFPGDEVLLVGYDYLRRFEDRHQVVVRRPTTFSRVAGEWIAAGVLANRWGADVLLSTSSVVSPLFRGRVRACVIHDWRHLQRPDEFPAAVRLYRKSWEWSASHADLAVQISGKTLEESRHHIPRARLAVVPNGRDHAAAWPISPLERSRGRRRQVVTFGHAVNKRPDLVLAAVARLPADIELIILGARGEAAEQLRRRASELGVHDRVELPGFVSEEVYRSTVTRADVLVLASTDEGFGLPVCEAEFFGIPCVVTDDSGLFEIHGDAVLVAGAEPGSLAAAIAAAADSPARTPDPQRVWSWRDTARGIREALEELC